MAKKASKKTIMTSSELVGILSDSIRNVRNGTVGTDEANAISSSARTICAIAKTQMDVYRFSKENPEAKLDRVID